MANLVVAASVESRIGAGVNEVVKVEGRRARERVRDGIRDLGSCMAAGVQEDWILKRRFLLLFEGVVVRRRHQGRLGLYLFRGAMLRSRRSRFTAPNHNAVVHLCCSDSRTADVGHGNRHDPRTSGSLTEGFQLFLWEDTIGYTCPISSLWAELKHA